MLMPLAGTTLRRSLEQWFDRDNIHPRNVGEFEDVALLHTFGTDGTATFAAPTVIEAEVARQYRVKVVGRTEQVRERYYALSPERRLKNPAVVAICERARSELFR